MMNNTFGVWGLILAVLAAGQVYAVTNEVQRTAGEWGSQAEYARAAYDEAMEYLSKGRQKDAEWLAAEACAEAPDARRLWFLKAVMQRSRFDWQPARDSFARAYCAGDESVPSRAAAIVVPMDMNMRIAENFQALEKLIEEHPDEILLRWLYGIEARYHDRHVEQGAEQFRIILKEWKIGPVMVHQTYAKLLTTDLDEPKQALEHRMLAVELEPEPWSYQGLAITFKKLKRYKEADRVYGKLLEMQPYNSINWIQWGNCMFYMGNYPAASDKFQKAWIINPRDIASLIFWGRCLEKQGRLEEGFAKYAEAVEHSPMHPMACSYTAVSSLYGYGCEPDYERAIELSAIVRGSPVDNLREYVRLADESDNPLSPEKSTMLIKHLTDLAENGNAEARFNLGMIHLHGIGIRSDRNAASKWFGRAASLGHAEAERAVEESRK